MTPKEKAKELVVRFYDLIESSYSGYYNTAKEMALYLCDEMLRELNSGENTWDAEVYWREVKQEIEKL